MTGIDIKLVDARSATIRAAQDLYGLCSSEVKSTIDAWHAVGVGPSTLQLNSLELTESVPSFQTDYQSANGAVVSSAQLEEFSDVKYESATQINVNDVKPGLSITYITQPHGTGSLKFQKL